MPVAWHASVFRKKVTQAFSGPPDDERNSGHGALLPDNRPLLQKPSPFATVNWRRLALDQNMSLQLGALRAAGCDKIFTDQLSGATTKRWIA
jgi:hypothetical protein